MAGISHDLKNKHLSVHWKKMGLPLRKHAYSNILKILSPKNENFQIKNSDIFHVSAQNIDCGYSLEPPQRGGSTSTHEAVLTSTHNLHEAVLTSTHNLWRF